MSVVTNVMLAVGIIDDGATQTLEALSVPGYVPYEQRFERLDEHGGWGGGKHPEVVLFGGAFNHLHLDGLLGVLAGLPWDFPEEVQLFIQEQDDDKWTVYELDGGSWCRLVKERS